MSPHCPPVAWWRAFVVVLVLAAPSVLFTQVAGTGSASASEARGAEHERAAVTKPGVRLTLKSHRITTKQRARVKVVLHPRRGSTQVDIVVIGDAGRRTVPADLVRGRAKAKLPRLAAGTYRVRAVFPGVGRLGKARSAAKTLTVVPQGGGAGSGFPDGTNTGVPPGVSLTTYTGPCTITRDGAVLDAVQINCSELNIQASGVVISRSLINGPVEVDTDTGRSWSVTLRDVEVDASRAGDRAAIANGNVTIIRANIHGGHNGLECQEHSNHCVIRDSWIHDQWQTPTGSTHLGGLLVLGTQVPCTGTGGACVEIVHNTIVCDAPENVDGGGCTGDINLLPHWGPLPGAIVTDNFLGANPGASFCTYGGAEMEYPATNVVYERNVFERGPNNQCAAFGPVTSFDLTAKGNRWVDNRYEDGAPVRPPS
jgi:hypothetical protein